jgi:hypothetical protein
MKDSKSLVKTVLFAAIAIVALSSSANAGEPFHPFGIRFTIRSSIRTCSCITTFFPDDRAYAFRCPLNHIPSLKSKSC